MWACEWQVRQESIADVLVAGGCCEIKAVQDKLRSMFRSQVRRRRKRRRSRRGML